jgi:hypothetical protein
MPTQTDPTSTRQGFLDYFASIQTLEGDEAARRTLSAFREVALRDRQLTPDQKASLLDHYDAVAKALRPTKT